MAESKTTKAVEKSETSEATDVAVVGYAGGELVSMEDLSEFIGLNDGKESIDSSDIKIPRWRILQPLSDEVTSGKGRPGDFINSMTNEIVKSVDLVIIDIKKGRSRMLKPFKKGSRPACYSTDRIHGIGDPGNSGITCEACEYNVWQEVDGKKVKACGDNMTFICLDPSTGSPSRLTLKGSAVNQAKDFISKFQLHPALCKFPFYVTYVKLECSIINGSDGTYALPEISLPFINDDPTKPFFFNKDKILTHKSIYESLADLIQEVHVLDQSATDDDLVIVEDGAPVENASWGN